MERKELLMTLMIGVLLLTTAMQTVALAGLSGGQVAVGGGTKSVASSSAPSSSPTTSGSSAGSLANLPSMVGGC